MGDVVRGEFITKGRIDPDHILEQSKGRFSDVLVLAYDKETEKFVASSSSPDAHLNVFMAQTFIHKEMNGDYGDVS